LEKTQLQPTPYDDIFNKVWATLDEISIKQKEIDRIMEKNALAQEKNAREMEEYNKRFGALTNRLGEVVEYMIAPNLLDKFRSLGFIFLKASKYIQISDQENNIFLEIDFLLENGEKAMLVEVKTNLNNGYINDHIERLEKMRKYSDLHGDKRTFLGAVAGVAIAPNVIDYALSKGLFVVEPSGETFNITSPRGKPKEW